MTIEAKTMLTLRGAAVINDNKVEGIKNREELAIKLGERIKEIRLKKELSQAELARRSGKDRQHLELIENSKVIPNIYTVYQIACALDISMCELFDW